MPVVQDSDLTAPSGDWPEGFITLPELSEASSDKKPATSYSAITTWIVIMEALGLPGEVLAKGGNEFLDAANRETERHRNRLAD